ncbi:MAG TPA: metalloregulator ArsR/SmtB family transcription factor [Acidimicrobiales bacterium]
MSYVHPLDALGDPTRRAVLESLRAGPRSVADIAAEFPVSRPAVSKHLRVLKDARLVTDEAVGTRRVYRLDPEGAAALRAYVDSFWDGPLAAFAAAANEHAKAKKGRKR